jgi:flagellar motor switch protein FliG
MAEAELPLYSGVDKVAIILLALGDEAGAEILTFFDPEEITKVSTAMVRLGAVPGNAVTGVVESFFEKLSGYTLDMGGLEQTERLLRKALPEEMVKMIMQEVSNASGVDIWRKLATVDRDLLSAYLRVEHPQTAALVLSQLGPELAARLLKSFDRKLACEIINRMLKMGPVQTEALSRVEEVLRSDFLATTANRRRTDSHAVMAEIFNYFDGRTEGELMSALSQANKDSADKIQRLMFTFKDLAKMDAAAIQTIIQATDKEVLARALKNSHEGLKKLFLSNMSARSAKRLEDDWQAMPTVSRSDVEAAQSTILKTTKSLIDKGEIRGAHDKEEDDEDE